MTATRTFLSSLSFSRRLRFAFISNKNSHRLYCMKNKNKNNMDENGTIIGERQVPSAAFFYCQLDAKNFKWFRLLNQAAMLKLFNIKTALKPDEYGFFLRPESDLFPLHRFQVTDKAQYVRLRLWFDSLRSQGDYELEKRHAANLKIMSRTVRKNGRQMEWIFTKHLLSRSGALLPHQLWQGALVAVETLCQNLVQNTLDRLVTKGMLTQEAVTAVQRRLGKLTEKQRRLLNLTADDVCDSDNANIADSTRIYLMRERLVDGKLFLDYFVQCLLQYKKRQSCTVLTYCQNGEEFDKIQLPKDYGYSMPRPVYATVRFSQQLKPERSEHVVITAFNFIAFP